MKRRKITTYILIFSLSIGSRIASANSSSPEEKSIFLVLQSLAQYNSIECTYSKETRAGTNEAWRTENRGTIFFDRQKSFYHFTEIERRAKNELWVTDMIWRDGKFYQITWGLKEGKEYKPVGAPLSQSTLTISAMSTQPLIELWEDTYKISGKHLLDLYKEKKIKMTDFSQEKEFLKLESKGSTFVFDRKTGQLLWKARRPHPKDKTVLTGDRTELSNYVNLKGWDIPTRIDIVGIDRKDEGSVEQWRKRYTLSKDSIKINEPNRRGLRFSYPIPKGTVVHDMFLGAVYRSTGTDGSIPAEDISGELDAIFEEAERL